MNSLNNIRPKATVIVVGILDSPHFARWLRTLVELPITFILFPSTPHRKIHPELRRLAAHKGIATVTILRFESRLTIPIWIIDLVTRGDLRAYFLRRRIKQEKPNLVHALELQHAGYALHKAIKGVPIGKTKIALTNYGSDIYWFQRFPEHKTRLTELMHLADFYSAECERDIELARAMGFGGEVLTVLPNAGGINDITSWSTVDRDQVVDRKTVLIKGYTNFVGRAQDIISVITANAKRFDGWSLIVYSATLRARLMCAFVRIRQPQLKLRSIRKKSLTHAEMINHFKMAAAYVGFSQSDGISTSFLEALAHGAYPLQTSTACVSEWRDRGALFSPLEVNDPESAVEELLRILGDSSLRIEAAKKNRGVALVYIDANKIGRQMREDYARILAL
jgi:glycosyltransferase involved in cell wall biosynthesis